MWEGGWKEGCDVREGGMREGGVKEAGMREVV